jgi:hypothetical protein
MKNIIDFIISQKELKEKPIVLLDIGASGQMHPEWKDIAKNSICIAFDADDREMGFLEKSDSEFLKLFIINRIVTATEQNEAPFYLTTSPYCSSLLEPDNEKLKPWVFADLFKIEKLISLPTTTIMNTLKKLGIDQIDWFKTDSQGTDLSLFKSLDKLASKIIVAEFEPGIISAYKKEDKLHDLLRYMDNQPFWLNRLDVQGTKRIDLNKLSFLSEEQLKIIKSETTNSSCWANALYFNDFTNSDLSMREYLAGIVFAIIKKQYGFGIELCKLGNEKFSNNTFETIQGMIFDELSKSKNVNANTKKNLKQRILGSLLSSAKSMAKRTLHFNK